MHPDREDVPGLDFVLCGHCKQASAVLALVICEYFPDTHSVHSELPTVTLYFPAAQAVHVPPFCLVVPTTHKQDNCWELPGYDDESVGHLVHTSMDVAADVVEYVSRAQLTHSELPVTFL